MNPNECILDADRKDQTRKFESSKIVAAQCIFTSVLSHLLCQIS